MKKYLRMSSAAVVIGALRVIIEFLSGLLFSYKNREILQKLHKCRCTEFLEKPYTQNMVLILINARALINSPACFPKIIIYSVYDLPVYMIYRCISKRSIFLSLDFFTSGSFLPNGHKNSRHLSETVKIVSVREFNVKS